MKILMIEDEPDLLRDLSRGLALKGYAVDCAQDGIQGYQMASDNLYDVIILDLNLPKMSGLEVLSKLKSENPYLKVLILSANHHLETKLSGFELGASDYLTKPFHFEELEARIRVLSNRQFVQHSSSIAYHTLKMNTLSREITVNGEAVSFTAKETAILEYFLLNQGRLITQQELIEHIWNGDVDPFSNSIRVHLSSMRKKLKAAFGYDPIQTKIGEGYLLL